MNIIALKMSSVYGTDARGNHFGSYLRKTSPHLWRKEDYTLYFEIPLMWKPLTHFVKVTEHRTNAGTQKRPKGCRLVQMK